MGLLRGSIGCAGFKAFGCARAGRMLSKPFNCIGLALGTVYLILVVTNLKMLSSPGNPGRDD